MYLVNTRKILLKKWIKNILYSKKKINLNYKNNTYPFISTDLFSILLKLFTYLQLNLSRIIFSWFYLM